jgi:hypothetical protein
VDQTATVEYAIHEFKEYAGVVNSCTIEWYGRTNCDASLSAVYLQIYNYITPGWETIDSNNTVAEDVNFSLTASKANLTNYKNGSGVATFRVYQLAL